MKDADDGGTTSVLETIYPFEAGVKIDDEKTIFVTTGTVGAIPIADIDTNFVKDPGWTPNDLTAAAAWNGGNIGEMNGSKPSVHYLDAVSHLGYCAAILGTTEI